MDDNSTRSRSRAIGRDPFADDAAHSGPAAAPPPSRHAGLGRDPLSDITSGGQPESPRTSAASPPRWHPDSSAADDLFDTDLLYDYDEQLVRGRHGGRGDGERASFGAVLKTVLGVLAILLGLALILSVSGDFWNRRGVVATAVVLRATPSPVPTTTPEPSPTITLTPIVIENTPTAGNPITAVAAIVESTALAEAATTRTPRPPNLATATPIVVVTNTPTPANEATAQIQAAESTLVALTTGTATPLPPNVVTASPTPTYYVITSVPTPANGATAQARIAEGTATARRDGTPTPLPTNWVTPIVVTATPTPANTAAADRLTVVAYVAQQTGTPTATPINVWTATPSPTLVIITSVPTPMNARTAEARAAQATADATELGEPTPVPPNWVTPHVVTATPSPANRATADRLTVVAYVAALTGTPTPTPENMWTATPSPTYYVITSVPTPGNAETAVARAAQATAYAAHYGEPTPLPPNWVTPVVLPITPTPANQATVDRLTVVAYLVILTGTPTPTPANMLTATPTALYMDEAAIYPTPTFTPTMTATPDPRSIPAEFFNKIAFVSDRDGGRRAYYIMDPDGGDVQRLTGTDVYSAALVRDTLDPTGQFEVFVSEPRSAQYDRDLGKNYEISLRRLADGYEWYITGGTKGADYNPAYCQADPRYIAWTSQQTGNDDIFVVDLLSDSGGGAPLRTVRLTENDWPWDKHPSWSPDCRQIVFFSNRDGRDQIWMMDFVGMDYAGGNPRNVSNSAYNDWDPVWIKPPPALPEVTETP